MSSLRTVISASRLSLRRCEPRSSSEPHEHRTFSIGFDSVICDLSVFDFSRVCDWLICIILN